MQRPLHLPGVLLRLLVNLQAGEKALVVCRLLIERTEISLLLFEFLDIGPVLQDALLEVSKPLVQPGDLLTEGVIIRLEGFHRRNTLAKSPGAPDILFKCGNRPFVLCKRRKVGLKP